MIDVKCGVPKIEVDVVGREMPATLDGAGGCHLASSVAGSPLTVVLGVDTD